MDTNSEEKRKRYYWLKLHEGFFDDPIIKKLRKIAGGDTYTCIYLKMMLMSVKTEGILIYEGIESSLEKELALKLDEEEENVKIVINYLFSFKLLAEESKQHRSYIMPAVLKMTGSEGSSAKRVREFRERQKTPIVLQCNEDVAQKGAIPLHCNSGVTYDNNGLLQCNPDVTQETNNATVLHCNDTVTACNIEVTECNDAVTASNEISENPQISQNSHEIDFQAKKTLHCNTTVTSCNKNETLENKSKDISCSSSFKDTTTTTMNDPVLKKWLSFKSQGKNNPQGYEYTLLKMIQEKDESVLSEYISWREFNMSQMHKDLMIELRGKSLLTQNGEKVILGIEQDDKNFKIYFEEGGYAVVQTLDNLPTSERI